MPSRRGHALEHSPILSVQRKATVTIVRVGTNKKYSDGWEAAFGRGKKESTSEVKASKATPKKATAKDSKKKVAKAKR